MGGGYPTGAWRAGDRMADRVTLRLPDDLEPGVYTVWLGVYYWQTGERLTPRVDGTAQPEDRFRLGVIEVP